MRPRKARVMRAPQLPGGSPMKIHQPLAGDVRAQVRLTTSGQPRDSPMFPATDRATAGPTATRGPRRSHYDTLVRQQGVSISSNPLSPLRRR